MYQVLISKVEYQKVKFTFTLFIYLLKYLMCQQKGVESPKNPQVFINIKAVKPIHILVDNGGGHNNLLYLVL